MKKHEGMKIPKAFWLFGHKIEVSYVDDLTVRQNAIGEARYQENKIYLQNNTPTYPQDKSQIEQTFYHELIHMIFKYSEREKLSKDEELVNIVASLLHQALTTAEYD